MNNPIKSCKIGQHSKIDFPPPFIAMENQNNVYDFAHNETPKK
jgi:hypothetical protein